MLAQEARSTLSQSPLCSFHGPRIQDDISYFFSPMRPSEKTKSVTLGYPFCLPAEGFGEACDSHAQPAALSERGWAHPQPPVDGNVASCSKPRRHLFILYKLHQLCETDKKQSAGKSLPSTLPTCFCLRSTSGVSLADSQWMVLQRILCWDGV